MAFANLFTRLAAVEEDVKSPVQPGFTHRNETGNGRKRGGRKRKNKGKQTGSYEKKPCYQTQTTGTYDGTSFKDDNHKPQHYQNTYHEYLNVGFNNKMLNNHSHKTGNNNMAHKGQNTKTRNERNIYQQGQQRKTREQQKNEHRQEDGRRAAYRGGRPAFRKDGEYRKNQNEDSKVKRTRFMTQEFKDQNVISVGDRFLCKHFLWGKCVKGDECQLEHVQGYNDLVKEVCKFYVQGTCMKGESCPYMHKSFPCKFFHRRGKCFQGENCKFSHEPLNDLTNNLLDQALKRENDQIALAKKAEQESSVQPVNLEESESIGATKAPDVLSQPLRTNFYQSAEISAEERSLLPQTEELSENTEESVTTHAAQPHRALSANLDQKEPVCYSVEAVLGPQLSKPFLSFYSAPRSQEPVPLRSSDPTPASASNKSPAPYSVEAVLRSFKSTETPTPPTSQTVTYPQKTVCQESTDLSLEAQHTKVFCPVNTGNEGNKFQEKLFQCLPSFQTHSNLIPNTRSDLTVALGEHKRQVGNMQESLKPVHEVKLLHTRKSFASNSKGDVKESKHLHTDIKCSVNSNSERGDQFGPNKHKTVSSNSLSLTSSSSEHPAQSHLSVLSSFKPFSPSSDSTKFKGKVTVSTSIKPSDSADHVGPLATKQPNKSDLHPKGTTADCSSKMADGQVAGGFKKTLKAPFHSLFAKPITDSIQLKEESSTATSCPRGLIQSLCPAPKSAGLKNNYLKTDKAPVRSFASLFAAPLSAALPSISQKSAQKVEVVPHSSDSKQGAASLQTQRHDKVNVQTSLRTGVQEICQVPRSSNFSRDPKKGNKGCSTECEYQQKDQACSPVSGSPSEQSTDHPMPEISSCKEIAAKSILGTLFQRLSPYQQDGDQQDSDQISVSADTGDL
ncbi:uncharacterized protein LOC117815974 isoform X2 [Notolabrus celidotus]|uniref:uncharacterized protein LOC117815974 isoform X2 n=1 Tax=Notolabrus celidotus TaxID=1203425 RepID=UPI0014903752|nr:uncharacterized protein LOC117815974 isoform X2 [Notolabrus celidotus]